MNLDIPPSLPGPLKEGIISLVDAAVAPKFDMDLEMIYELDGKPGRLQAVETGALSTATQSQDCRCGSAMRTTTQGSSGTGGRAACQRWV